MSIHRQKYFHLSQVTVPRNTVYPTHHRPLALFLVFLMLAQQVGILGTSAWSIWALGTTQQYTYIQTNPTIDDSWIWTRVTTKNTNLSTTPVIKPSIYSINTGTYQVSDGSWILPKKPTKNTNPPEQQTEFNSAPLVPVAQIPMNIFSAAPLVTPNGTAFVDIGGNNYSSSLSIVNNGIISGDQSVGGNSSITGNQVISGSLSVSGSTILSNLASLSIQTDTLTLGGGVGTPTKILGRDDSGSVNNVSIGSGLTLSGGVLSILSTVLSVTTDWVSEWLNNLYFTDLRAQNALSGTIATINTALVGINSNIFTATGNISTLSGNLATTNSNLATTNSNLTTTNSNLFTLSGTVNTLSGRVTTLSWTVATLASASHTALTLATTNGLSLVGQQLSLALASSTTTGALSATDWNIFNSKENSLTFGTGITRVGNNIGIGTLTGGLLSGFNAGQLTFGSASGGLTQSSSLFWDNTNGRLGIGTNSPLYTLDLRGSLRVWNWSNGTIYLGDWSFTKNSGSSWFFVWGLGTNAMMTANQFDATSGTE